MTVIAYRKGIMASDSRDTVDQGIAVPCPKVYKQDGVLYGGTGKSPQTLLFHDWMTYSDDPEDVPTWDGGEDDADTCILIVVGAGSKWYGPSGGREPTKPGIYLYWGDERLHPIALPFFAVGGDGMLAMGAMAAGASAERAVQLACKYGTHSALPLQKVKL